MWPWIERPQGWQCPNCGSAHAPSVLTCPAQLKTTDKLVIGSPIPAPVCTCKPPQSGPNWASASSADPACPVHGGWSQNVCFCEGLTMPHTHSQSDGRAEHE